jgi:hypothetical protein
MTLAVGGAQRGRPATTVAGLSRSLERSRLVNHDLRSRMRAEIVADTTYVEDVRARAYRIHLAITADRPDLALHEASAIVVASDRRLTQLGSVIL